MNWAAMLKRVPRAIGVLLGVDVPVEPEKHVQGPLPPSKASLAYEEMQAKRAAAKKPVDPAGGSR
jgi:hypothetical protein